MATGPVPLTLSACDAGEGTYAFAHADVGDPAVVGAALDALVQATARNVGSAVGAAGEPVKVPGMTPHPSARRVRLEGRRPDGRAVHVVVWVFSHGTQVHQATLLGERIDEAAADTFFGSVQVVR